MFFSSHSPSDAYAKVGAETGVIAANPHKLVLMLIEGALLALAMAKQAMQEGRIGDKGNEISRAIEIITNGLKASLNFDEGGDLSTKLAALYDYMCTRLLHANLHNDQAALDEVKQLLQEIKSAWEEIASDPTVVSGGRKVT